MTVPVVSDVLSSVNGSETADITTDVLIVGTGPSGASLACFLGSHGLKGLVIGRDSASADSPRAHITSAAALECLRDVELDKECVRLASSGDCMIHTRWCQSMAGEELARIYSWGHDPRRKGDYESASPCTHVDLPQTLLEPLLVRYATVNGFRVRFDTSLVSFVQNEKAGTVTTTVKDTITEKEYRITSKYLFGADGARSRIMRELEIPLIAKPGQGLAINVLVKADLSHLIDHRKGNLHWIMQPDKKLPEHSWTGIVRMVKPWHEWMFILLPAQGVTEVDITKEEYMERVRSFIGDDSIPAEILSISKWNINEIVAETYQKGNVFCLGDAVHRHPPFNGLGSNTCIQDAFNLAWKIAYVLKGKADKSILDTYSTERQPVGLGIVTRANDGFRDHFHVWQALGMTEPDHEKRAAIYAELNAATEAGKARRAALSKAIEATSHEFHGLGVEMNQLYQSKSIITSDEVSPTREHTSGDPVLYYEKSTYPGSRLPHVWLNTAVPGPLISTLDLSGHGDFALFTGIGGEAWKEAAEKVGAKYNVGIKTTVIGWRRDLEDAYFEWEKVRGVEESGAVLARPDRFVAWRSQTLGENPEQKLEAVIKQVLGL
ncbi:MAG: hypothetical protein M1819_001642 [Sarea resinae]|nr:MAG: hypothetical protein M1819_001642 [Sarea resinae]